MMGADKIAQAAKERKELALVILRATAIDPPFFFCRLKRRRPPFLKRIRRLDIIMPIEEQCRRPVIPEAFAKDHGRRR